MRNLILLLSFISASAFAADVKISELPLSPASGVTTNDSFPYVDVTTGFTERLKLSDLKNLPTMVSQYAPIASPTFTGVAKSPVYGTTAATIASAGVFRSANTESHCWRNAANSADICVSVDASNIFQFTGAMTSTGAINSTAITVTGAVSSATVAATGLITAGSLTSTGTITSGALITTSGASSTTVKLNSTSTGNPTNSVQFLALSTTDGRPNWLFGTNQNTNGVLEIVPSTAKAGTTWSATSAIQFGVSGADGSYVGTVAIPGTLSITGATTAAAITSSGLVKSTGTGFQANPTTGTNVSQFVAINTGEAAFQIGVENSAGNSTFSGLPAYSSFIGTNSNNPIWLYTHGAKTMVLGTDQSVTAAATLDATSTIAAALISSGGLAVAKKAFIGGDVTFGGSGGSVTGLTYLKMTGTTNVSIAGYGADAGHQNGGTQTYVIGSGVNGLLVIDDVSTGVAALFFLTSDGTVISSISDPSTAFSTSANTANKWCITNSAGTLTLRNNLNTAARSVYLTFIRTG